MSNKKEVATVSGQNALQEVASRLKISPDSLTKVLKASVIKGIKGTDGRYRPATNEEFMAFMVVANTYKLNPLTKEIYAFPDTNSKGIIPIVSTDGWNKLMTDHRDYKRHYYTYAEETVTMPGAKPCPEWMEIHIVKTDDSEVVIREYLDECFRELSYGNPWKTHTKRMLRHKTKIQGAREAFGFSGIYDEDEGERILEVTSVSPDISEEGSVITVEATTEVSEDPADDNLKLMQTNFDMQQKRLGDEKFFAIIGQAGFEKAAEITDLATGQKILAEMAKTKVAA